VQDKASKRLAVSLGQTQAQAAVARDKIERRPRPILDNYGFRPFLIYQIPDHYRDSLAGTEWRKFRIRGGIIFVNGTLVNVTGTDGTHDDPFAESYPAGSFDILADDAVPKFWFWIEITDPTGTPTAAIQSSATAPTWDSTHIPIAWVNTETTGVPVVRPLLFDLFTIVC
jgi:hypothetical protein